MLTIAEVLHDATARLRAASIDDAALEAELLLMHALDLTREQLFMRLHDHVPHEKAPLFEHILGRRLEREPLAYITGDKEFYGLDLLCSPAALIPRPETELLVELALDWLKGRRSRVKVTTDVGTGNGAIAVALAAHAPCSCLIAVDNSRPALALARENARRHAVDGRIGFVRADLLSPIGRPVDLIVGNLPYVSTAQYERAAQEVREHEPEAALHAGPRGTELIERLLPQAAALLTPGGLLLAEHGWDQGEHLRAAARASFPHARIETKRDLAGEERVLVVVVNG